MADPVDFRPTEAQRGFLERHVKLRFDERIEAGILVFGGRRGGRRAAMELGIRVDAADEHEAELAIRDLREHGVAALTEDGRRYEPPSPPRPRIAYDEIP